MNAFVCPVLGMTQNCLTVTKNPKKILRKENHYGQRKC